MNKVRKGALMALFLFVVMVIVALPLGGVIAQDGATAVPSEVSPEMLLTQERAAETAASALTATANDAAPVADVVVESIESGTVATPSPNNDAPNVSVTVATPEADNSELYVLITAVVAIVAVAVMGYLKERQSKPAEAALSYQDSLNRAAATPGIYDESMLQFWLMIRGFPVERLPDGSFKVSPPPAAPPTGTSP